MTQTNKTTKKIELKPELVGSKPTIDITKVLATYNIDEVQKVYGTKSAMVRYFYSEGLSAAVIWRVMVTKYPKMIRQHVHNIINQYKSKVDTK